jgi:hypothetical protein
MVNAQHICGTTDGASARDLKCGADFVPTIHDILCAVMNRARKRSAILFEIAMMNLCDGGLQP